MKLSLGWFLFFFYTALAVLSHVSGTHFRYMTIDWKRVDEPDNPYKVCMREGELQTKNQNLTCWFCLGAHYYYSGMENHLLH